MKKSDKVVTEESLDKRLKLTEKKFDEKLKGFATKSYLDERLEKQSVEIIQTISDLFSDKIDKIAVSQDRLLKNYETWEQENAVGAEQTRRLTVKVDDHETRLKKLESVN